MIRSTRQAWNVIIAISLVFGGYKHFVPVDDVWKSLSFDGRSQTMLADLNLIKITLLFVVLFFAAGLLAQPTATPSIQDSSRSYKPSTSSLCSNDMILARQRKDPAFTAREQLMNNQILNASDSLLGDTITLPVVFHIINNNPNSITDMQITNALQELNEAFSKSGKYSGSAGVDTKIRFCLSQKDPDGGNSTGITRTKSFFSTNLNKDIEDARLKNLIQWDPSKYINIWLVSSIDAEAYADFACGSWFRLGMAGYSTMPPGGGPLDGIVVTGFGVLLAHEMGHYLGLYHTFEGWCTNNDCTTDGDRVCDTPPDGSLRPSGGCNSPTNSCNTDTLSKYSNGIFRDDVPDQVSNLMDYGNSACANQFTQGQADRMRAAIQTQRSGLLDEKCIKPCPDNIVAAFTRNSSYPLPGDQISYTNRSTGASNYEWLVNDVVVSKSSDMVQSFNAVGKYKVTLKAFGSNNCFASYTDYIVVTCGVTARFYSNKTTVASKLNIYTDTIIFTNNSYNGQTFQWLMSHDQGMAEQVVSTDRHLTYVFPTPGNYTIRLVATNGSCSDTTGLFTVPVLEPTADGVPFNVSISCLQQNKIQINFCISNYGFAPLPKNSVVSFYDADPRVAGAKKLGTTFKLPTAVPGYCYLCFTHVVNIPYRAFEKVFVVYNDTGTVVPVVLPNTSFVEKSYTNNFTNSPPTRTTVTASICAGQSFLGYSKSGTYYDTLVNSNGCEYIRTLELTVKPVYYTTVTTSICEGENYAGHITTGTFVD
ncbi:MAG: M43 family zinc metalloprotease, partial [Flavitalea sp.]